MRCYRVPEAEANGSVGGGWGGIRDSEVGWSDDGGGLMCQTVHRGGMEVGCSIIWVKSRVKFEDKSVYLNW